MISIIRMIKDDRAVSESLGYILLFAITVTAIGIILMLGYPVLNNQKSQDNFQNMQQSFSIIQSNINQVALEQTPVMTTMLHMQGGTFGINSTAGFLQIPEVGYDNFTGQMYFLSDNDLMDNLSIEDGGVWEASDNYFQVISEPRIYIAPRSNTLVLNIIRMTNSTGIIANSGSGSINVEAMYDNTSVYTYPLQSSITFMLNTSYPIAWGEYLNSMLAGHVSNVAMSSNGITATIGGINGLIISEHCVNISLSGAYGQ
jgi:FlaG/FlaF family flagellin (archaellin)